MKELLAKLCSWCFAWACTMNPGVPVTDLSHRYRATKWDGACWYDATKVTEVVKDAAGRDAHRMPDGTLWWRAWIPYHPGRPAHWAKLRSPCELGENNLLRSSKCKVKYVEAAQSSRLVNYWGTNAGTVWLGKINPEKVEKWSTKEEFDAATAKGEYAVMKYPYQ